MAAECGAAHISVVPEHEVPAEFSRIREVIPIALEFSPGTTIVKASVLPMRMKEMVEAAARIADGESVPWAAVARGLGVIVFRPAAGGEWLEERGCVVERATNEILAACTKLEGQRDDSLVPERMEGHVEGVGTGARRFSANAKSEECFRRARDSEPGAIRGRAIGHGRQPSDHARRSAARVPANAERLFRKGQTRVRGLFALQLIAGLY